MQAVQTPVSVMETRTLVPRWRGDHLRLLTDQRISGISPSRLIAASGLTTELDAFFASVGRRDDPRRRGLGVIVSPGVVPAARRATQLPADSARRHSRAGRADTRQTTAHEPVAPAPCVS
jgi:hypothetical protein